MLSNCSFLFFCFCLFLVVPLSLPLVYKVSMVDFLSSFGFSSFYKIVVDLDNQKAIDEFCARNGVITPLSELANSNSLIVEEHKDAPDKAHSIIYATHPFPKKSSDIAALSTRLDSNQVPAIEVKGAGEHGLLFVTPSPHKNGHNYEIIGTTELSSVVDAFESHIDNIWSKYGIPYLNGNNNNGNNSEQHHPDPGII